MVEKQPVEVLCKKRFLKNSQISQENTSVESPFNKVADLQYGYF